MRAFLFFAASLSSLPALAQEAAVADCVRDIKGDSVALYFDGRYQLTPVACATMCRFTHLGPKGSLYGEVRDYRLPGQQLAFRQHYVQGVRQGSYEAFYPNGQVQVRGTFTNGDPSGEWQWWYADGRPRQTLRRDPQAPQGWRYVAYTDSATGQSLTDGTGHWRELSAGQRQRIEGEVRGGLPDGEWQLYRLDLNPNKPLTVETYEKGVFRKGVSKTKLGTFPYPDHARVQPTLDDPTAPGLLYRRGLVCAARGQAAAPSAPAAGARDVQPPRPGGDPAAYLRLILDKLEAYPDMNGARLNPEFVATVDADVDATGKFSNLRSSSADVQRIFVRVVPSLGRWEAATVDKRPTTSRVQFRLHLVAEQWRLEYQITGIDVAPAAVSATP